MTSQPVVRKSVKVAFMHAALMLIIAVVNAHADDINAIPVEVGQVVVQNGQAPLWTPGTVVSRQNANIAPEISGRLVWLAEVGDYVSAGETIARINDTAWQIQLRTDEAEIRRLEANEKFLHRQVARFRTLSDSNSMAAAELDRLTMDLRMLEQERAAREARRDGTLYSIEVANVAAPFSGLIVVNRCCALSIPRRWRCEHVPRSVSRSTRSLVRRSSSRVAMTALRQRSRHWCRPGKTMPAGLRFALTSRRAVTGWSARLCVSHCRMVRNWRS